MTTATESLRKKAEAAKAASRLLARASTATKDAALANIAAALERRKDEIAAANKQDYEQSKRDGMNASMLDRLLLDAPRVTAQAADVRKIIALPDPVGETFDARVLPNGLRIGRRRVPLGVIGAIYESRPNVTVDIATLCLKSGNAVVLRGGKEAIRCNTLLAQLQRDAIAAAGLPADAIQFVDSTDRALVGEMLKMRDVIDLMVPRGGADLIRMVSREAAMPVLAGGVGVCHLYVDKSADVEMATEIVFNAKVQRPSTCNALDTVLVHRDAAQRALPAIGRRLAAAKVELRCDPQSLAILQKADVDRLTAAAPGDFGMEFLDLIASVKVVDDLDGAIRHIEQYGSGHSEAIVTSDYAAANAFMDAVDAAAVYVNASTRFTDGGQFGLGSEVGISTQKFHARGPMGLREMTSYKWTIFGDGHVRP
ncbi:MAG: glutamate-5-semialdehyde dehydrogenase [Dehalococcoidia bacterium]|nr:glutamate-5-semialdehyde dehydrogenase [Dehalococcoidia bacterium]